MGAIFGLLALIGGITVFVLFFFMAAYATCGGGF